MKKIYTEPTLVVVAIKKQKLLSESVIQSGEDWKGGEGQETASRSFFGFGDDEE